MRNIFDQYTQPENRLTHALAICLHEDRELLRCFLVWAGVRSPVSTKDIVIIEQSLPGDPPELDEVSERDGLPDIVIHDDEDWCVILESKVQARLIDDQLRRHEGTLRRRGFHQVHRLVVTKSGVKVPKGTIAITWSGLYEWLGTSIQKSEWADRLRSYLRAAEVRLVRDEYLTQGTLTMFDGFPFSDTNPYTYGEAKRLLNLALEELREDRSVRELGIDPEAPGRAAITGRAGRAVWDFIPLKDRPTRGSFTGYPHLTLAVHADHLEASITIPNGVIRPVRQRLIDLGSERLIAINAKILRRARGLISRGAWIQAYALQRHYLRQSSPAITDAMLTYRLETSQPRSSGRVKRQLEWVELFAALPRKKQSNMQFQYRVHIPWATKGINTRESLRLISESWNAMKPLLDALRGES